MSAAAPSRTFKVVLRPDEHGVVNAIDVPFDPKEAFGKVRAPVVVAIGGHEYRSTVFRMDGRTFVPLRTSHRGAAKVTAGQTVRVTLTLDDAPRTVETPADLVKALRAAKLGSAWDALSYTHRREHVEAIKGAKKPETRERRIVACVEMVAGKAGSTGAKAKRTTTKPTDRNPSA